MAGDGVLKSRRNNGAGIIKGRRIKGWRRNGDHMERISWDEYFMEMAVLASKRSTCLRRQVGAVIVRDKTVLATGYNGAPKGLTHCEERGGCLREQLNVPSGERHELCIALHAEQNAIIQAATSGQSIDGATIYITHQPCVICAKMIINAGIKRIIVKEGYPDELATKMLAEAGLKAVLLGDAHRDSYLNVGEV